MVPLEACKLFNNFSEDELKSLRQVTQEKSFKANAEIFKEGDPGDGMYVVKSGGVQISAMVSENDRRVLSRLEPGDSFGEMAVLDSEPRSACAIAEHDSVLYFISRDDLLCLLEKIPRLSAKFVHDINKRLRDFNRHYIQEVVQAERLALVGRFARSIVHDLKNPLNIIGIAAELAGMETASAESRQSAKVRIRRQVDRITGMVNELLEFTRSSQTSIALSPTDYATFVQQTVDEIRPEIELKGVKLEIATPPPSVTQSVMFSFRSGYRTR